MNYRKETIFPFWMKVGISGVILFMMAGGIWFFKTQEQQQQREVESQLMAIATLKSRQIADWRKEKLDDAAILMQQRDLIESVKHFFLISSGQDASAVLKPLGFIKERYHYADIFVVDPQKHIRLNLGQKTKELCQGYATTLDKAIAGHKPLWTPLHIGPEYPSPHLSVVVPLFNEQEGRKYIGTLVLIDDATRFLYPLIQSWPTPSATAETLLVQRDGDDVILLNELRHKKNTALKLRIPLIRADLPAAMAVAGKTGIVEGKDYRGVKVIAAIMPIPNSHWFMVSKLDSKEAFADWHFRSTLILIVMMGAMGFLMASWFINYQRNRKAYYRGLYWSEKELRRATERYSITLHAIGDAVIATDNKGKIEMINPVAEAITGWTFEEAKGKDLSEVFRIVNEKTRKPVNNPVAKVLKEGAVVNLANHTLLITKDGQEIPISDSGAPIRDKDGDIIGVVLVFRDQTEERRTQRFIETRLSLVDYASSESLDELLAKTIDEICDLLNSPIGFYHFVEQDQQTLSLQQWSTRTLKEFCRAQGKGIHYDVAQAGVWVDCVHERKPVIHNDYASLPHKKSLPDGHAEIIRELVVPVIRNNMVVAILGVGNKQIEYTQRDADTALYLADMTWTIISNKRAEEALQFSLEKFEKTFQAAPVWVVLNSLENGQYLEVNDAFLNIMGYDNREEVIGKTSEELDTWADPQDRKHIAARLIKKERIQNLEIKRKTRSGKLLDTLFSADTLCVEDQEIIISVTQDISEQKKARELQQNTESVYAALFDNINIAVAVYKAINDGDDFIFVDFNEAAEKIENITKEYLIGKSVLEVFPGVRHFGLFDVFQRVWKTGESEHFPLKQYKDERIFGWRENFVYKSPSGEIVAVYTDETERVQDYENLFQSEERQRSILSSIHTGILIIDAESHKIVEANPAAIEMIGNPKNKVIGSVCHHFTCPAKKGECPVTDFGKDIHNSEELFLNANGDEIPVLKTISPIIFGERTYLLESVVDISERKKLEAQLQQSQKMESIGRLAGGVAHDFNNMLGVIIGNAQLAMRQLTHTEPVYKDLQEIMKAAERSADITRQLLAFARKQTITPKVLDLNDTIEGMLKMLRRLIGEDIDLIWKPDTTLRPVMMDPSQIDQLLANLCVNSRDALPGTGEIIIETENVAIDEDYCLEHTEFVPGEYAMLTISDDGSGMDRETLDNIFEPFFTTKELGQGTGLGLSTVHGIVKQNNGFINVYSEPGQGTTFKIYLPSYSGKIEAWEEEAKEQPPQSRGETILIVEDEASVLNVSKRMLEKLNYTVLTADSASEALRLAKEYSGEIHLLLTDVVMPNTSGKDLAKKIIKIRPDIKTVFMSGYTADTIAHRGILAEGVSFIQKPFNTYSLAKKVRDMLDVK